MQKNVNKTLALPPDLVIALEDIARARSSWHAQYKWSDILRTAGQEYVKKHHDETDSPKPLRRRKVVKS